jgi:hypothetical protein
VIFADKSCSRKSNCGANGKPEQLLRVPLSKIATAHYGVNKRDTMLLVH